MIRKLHAIYVVAVLWLIRKHWPEDFASWLRAQASSQRGAHLVVTDHAARS